MTDDKKQKTSEPFSSEIISPMFGHDFQNRVVTPKTAAKVTPETPYQTSYLEKQIAEEVASQTKSAKVKAYQQTCKTDTDVLQQYHKQKENEELQAALPSHYLNFRDNLQKTADLTTISDFDFSDENQSTAVSTSSEILDEIFEKIN